MQPPDASDDLIISTPERVSFQYEIAGIGSRFLAQIIDSLIILVVLIAITILAGTLGGIFNSGELALLVEIILGFILLAGYFLVSEAVWNGQTVGKRSATTTAQRRSGRRSPGRANAAPSASTLLPDRNCLGTTRIGGCSVISRRSSRPRTG